MFLIIIITFGRLQLEEKKKNLVKLIIYIKFAMSHG